MPTIRFIETICIISIGLAIRSAISLYSYSGFGNYPMFGDYEAQRHWQEVTINLPITEWYKNGTENDLQYWGIDYPPLTAYHSYALGKLANIFEPESTVLHESRGYESGSHKSYMRLTVLAADLLIYLPSLCVLIGSLKKLFKWNSNSDLSFALLVAIYPGQILIDNGHFQYNNISLGFAAAAIAAIFQEMPLTSALLFSCSLNYKQMSLYMSLPFFSYLLGSCSANGKGKLANFFKLAAVTSLTFFVLWMPWMRSVQDVASVLKRLFPVHRGIFEDKVGNFWCAVNVFYKFRKSINPAKMALICMVLTSVIAIPINLYMFRNRSRRNFAISLYSTALAFFLFSYQVHEKSILLAVIPAFCLFYKSADLLYFIEISVFSMFPLLCRDGLSIPFCLTMCAFRLTFKSFLLNSKSCLTKPLYFKVCPIQLLTYILIASICTYGIAPAPPGLDHVWQLLNALISFSINFAYIVWATYDLLQSS